MILYKIYGNGEYMKLIVDLLGADLGPEEILNGVIDALENTKFNFILVGPESIARDLLNQRNADLKRFEFVDTNEYILNEEDPARSLRRKKDSSITLGLNKLNEEAEGFLSAGSTGALLAGGIFITKRLDGVLRSTLATFVPNKKNSVTILVDSGSNVDSKAEMLNQFAIMGSIASEKFVGKSNPKVYLANVGVEKGKGDALSKETYELLEANQKINFKGNIEARDFLSGEADVIVADGFSGNMMVKATEGAAAVLFDEIKEKINQSFVAKLGALLMKSSLKQVKDKYDYKKVGAGVILGINKPIFKAHGSSNREAIKYAIYKAEEFINSKTNEKLEENL